MIRGYPHLWNLYGPRPISSAKTAKSLSAPGELKSHILSVSESVIREGHKKKLPGPKVVEALRQGLWLRSAPKLRMMRKHGHLGCKI